MEREGYFSELLKHASENSIPRMGVGIYIVYVLMLLLAAATSAFPLVSYLLIR